MENLTNAIMLREESSRAQVALVYGVAGVLAGMLFFSGRGN